MLWPKPTAGFRGRQPLSTRRVRPVRGSGRPPPMPHRAAPSRAAARTSSDIFPAGIY